MKRLYYVLVLLYASYCNAVSLESFEVNTTVESPTVDHHIVLSNEERELMYQIFVYNGNLDEAKQIVNESLLNEPKSLFWHQKALEVATWTNDQRLKSQALKFLHLLDNKQDINTTVDKEYSGESPAEDNKKRYNPHGAFVALKKKLKHKSISAIHDTQELKQISDLAWQYEDAPLATKASLQLIRSGEGRGVDYERMVIRGYKDRTFKKHAASYALEAYRRSHHKYIVLGTMYQLISHNDTQEALKLTQSIESKYALAHLFMEDREYLYLKLLLMLKRGDHRGVDGLLNQYPFLYQDERIASMLLWTYIDQHAYEQLSQTLMYLNEQQTIAPSLWLPMASGYFIVQKLDMSQKYLQKLLEADLNSIDVHFLKAYIFQAKGQENAFMKEMMWIYAYMRDLSQHDPSLLQRSDFVTKYLNSAMYCLGADDFTRMLSQYKQHMKKASYHLVSVAWALKNSAPEKVKMEASKLSRLDPWLKLNMALQQDRSKDIQNLLYQDHYGLPIRDRVISASRLKDISFAQTLAYKGLEDSRNDAGLYNQYINLVQTRESELKVDTGILNRADALSQEYISFYASYPFAKGFGLSLFVDHRKNHITNSLYFSYVKPNETRIDLGVSKAFDHFKIDMHIGHENALEAYDFAKIGLMWHNSSRVTSTFSLFWHTQAYETTYLLLGGYKDAADLTFSYLLLPSTQLTLNAQYATYYSQDNRDLGEGSHMLALVRHHLRRGYPDISTALFAEYGEYQETEGSRGVIDRLMPYAFGALPDDFANIGINLQYGLQNEVNYVRPWRPYGEATALYDMKNRHFSYLVRGGVSGAIATQTKMNIGFDYNQALYGTNEKSYTFYIKFKFFY